MFTVCPKCALTLAVTAADLRVGQGYVRCGRCASVFNALAGLHDEAAKKAAAPAAGSVAAPAAPQAAPDAPAAAPAPAPVSTAELVADFLADDAPAVSPLDEAPSDTMEFALGSADLAQIFISAAPDEGDAKSGTFETIVLEGGAGGAQFDDDPPYAEPPCDDLRAANAELERIAIAAGIATADPGSGTTQMPALEALPVAANDPLEDDEDEPAQPDRTRLLYKVGSVLLGALLLAQLVHSNRNDLAANPALTGVMTSLFGLFGQTLTPRWEPGALDVRQLGAVEESNAGGHLLVRASIRNEATRAQPLPVLRLTLQDRYGKRVASRDLLPAEYLGRSTGHRDAYLAAGERVDAEVAIVDPGRNAVGFELDACLPTGQGSVACASDRPKS